MMQNDGKRCLCLSTLLPFPAGDFAPGRTSCPVQGCAAVSLPPAPPRPGAPHGDACTGQCGAAEARGTPEHSCQPDMERGSLILPSTFPLQGAAIRLFQEAGGGDCGSHKHLTATHSHTDPTHLLQHRGCPFACHCCWPVPSQPTGPVLWLCRLNLYRFWLGKTSESLMKVSATTINPFLPPCYSQTANSDRIFKCIQLKGNSDIIFPSISKASEITFSPLITNITAR